MNKKQNLGQYYTTKAQYIISDLIKDIPVNCKIIDPFAGNGDLLNLFDNEDEAYDIDPQYEWIIKQDTLKYPTDYSSAYIVTNPPYLARNKNKDKEIYDKYKVNDLYKAALKTIESCLGGIIILPLNFLCDEDNSIRDYFLSKFTIINLKIFEETVFDDTSYTVCAFSFKKEINHEQIINTIFLPSKEKKQFTINKNFGYKLCGEFYNLIKNNNDIKIGRLLEGQISTTNINLRAIDSGSFNKRISLSLGEPYYGKQTDRAFATITSSKEFNLIEQQEIVDKFNVFLELNREKYNSLFLTNFRNSTSSYARKRISFDAAYKIIKYIC